MADEYIKFESHGLVLIMTQDYMQAYLIIKPDADPDTVTLDHLAKLLMTAKITNGVIDAAIARIITSKSRSEKILIAQGQPMKPEIWDHLDFYLYFNFPHLPRIVENQRMSFKDIHLIENVVCKQILVQRIRSSQGEEVVTVQGARVPFPIETVPLPQGPGTEISRHDPNLLVASVNGHAFLNGGKVCVSPEYTIHGHVDHSTGNILFLGSLTIEGDVKEGFEVKSGGDIRIKGLVEKAEIDCGGDLWVEGGIIGSPHTKVRTRGDCRAFYVENCQLDCDGSLQIEKYCHHSHLRIGKNVQVGRPENGYGAIIGGNLQIAGNLRCGNLGNPHNTATSVMLGINPFLRADIEKCYQSINKLIVEQNRLQKEQDSITRIFESGSPIDNPFSLDELQAKQSKILLELSGIQKMIDSKKKAFQALEEAYTRHIMENKDRVGQVEIYQTLYPGTVLRIRESEFHSPDPLNHVVVFEHLTQIEWRTME